MSIRAGKDGTAIPLVTGEDGDGASRGHFTAGGPGVEWATATGVGAQPAGCRVEAEDAWEDKEAVRSEPAGGGPSKPAKVSVGVKGRELSLQPWRDADGLKIKVRPALFCPTLLVCTPQLSSAEPGI